VRSAAAIAAIAAMALASLAVHNDDWSGIAVKKVSGAYLQIDRVDATQ
jgi:hypothetical protein